MAKKASGKRRSKPSAAEATVSQLQEALAEAGAASELREEVSTLGEDVASLRGKLEEAHREVSELRGKVDFSRRDERFLAINKGQIELDRDFKSGEIRVRVRCGRRRAFGRTIAECLAKLRPFYEKAE